MTRREHTDDQIAPTSPVINPTGGSFAGLGRLLSQPTCPAKSAPQHGNPGQVRDLLENAQLQGAEVYWYPGGGSDLAPLLLMPEDTVFQRQGFQPQKQAHSPLLLWITDLTPVEVLLQADGWAAQPYRELWRRLGADCRIIETFCVDLGLGAPLGQHYILDAEIVRLGTRDQRFRFVYSQARAEEFPQFFALHNARLSWIAFIKATGGFGGPSADLLMKQLSKAYPPSAMPEAIIGDKNFSSGGWPGYTRLGSRSPGWVDKTQLRPENRLNTRGVKGWGSYGESDWSNVALWPRDDLYDHFMNLAHRSSWDEDRTV